MDFDHGNGSSQHSRTDIEEKDECRASKNSGIHPEFVVRSRSRHSSEKSGSIKDLSEESGCSKPSRRHLELDETDSSKHLGEGSGSSGHLRRHVELDYETRSSKNSSEGSGSGRHSDAYPELIYGGGGHESNHFEIIPEIIEGWGNNDNFEVHSEAIDGSISSTRSEVIQAESNGHEGNILFSAEKLRLSSSSSGSSTDDQFQADTKLSKSRSGITSTSSLKFDEDQQPLQDNHHVSGNNSSKSEESQKNGSAGPTLTSQVSSVTHESTSTQSPSIQVMDRLGEYDPYRIPSAVFARSKSTTPTDWSIASNDSLFSIQVGNNSFSRDHILNLKSGELFKSGEFIAFSPSPVAPVEDPDKKSSEVDKSKAPVVSDAAVKDKIGLNAEEPIRERPTHPTVSWNPSTISNHSDDSGNSECSFAFPIRKKKKKKKKKQKQKKGACPSCYCSNCSWAFCYCWNCSIKRWCCHFSNVLTDGKNVCVKEKVEQQQQQQEQPLASAAPSKSACCSCCTCFPSCRWRWHWHWCCSYKCCC